MFAWLGVMVLACGGQSQRSSPGAARGGTGGVTGVSGTSGTSGSSTSGGASTSGGSSTAGSSGTGGAGAAGTSGGVGGTGEELAAEETLVIPLRPLDANSLSLALPVGSDPEASPAPLSLALGDGYPRVVRFDFEQSYWADPNAWYEAAPRLTLTGVTTRDDGIDARVGDAKTLEIEIQEVGDFAVYLELLWTPLEPGEPTATTFTKKVMVQVRRMGGMNWEPCSDESAVVVSGAGFRSAHVEPVDEDGAGFYPANASYARPVTVSVHARPGTKLSTQDGLALLVVEGPEQSVEVRSEQGDAFRFDLIEPESIDALSASFHLDGPWTRGSSEIESGSVVAVPLSRGPGRIFVVPEVEFEGRKVCSPASPDWFALASNTPNTCPIAEEPVCAEGCFLTALPNGATALASGACELSLEAASFDGGRGLSTGLSMEFVEPPAN